MILRRRWGLLFLLLLLSPGCLQGEPSIHRLTHHPAKEAFPAFTPEGRILYASEAEGNFDLWIMAADGSEKKPLTRTSHYEASPSPLPDGRILFESGIGGKAGLWVLDPGGGDATPLSPRDGGWYSDPALSPDGKWAAYINTTPDGRRELWIASLTGEGEARRVLGGGFPSRKKDPSWSPDGERIAFAGMEGEESWEIFLVGRDGEGLEPLTGDGSESDRPRWAPGGKGIVYRRQRETIDLWWIDVEGGRVRPFITGTETMQTTAFSPDGKRFVFDARREGNVDLWLVTHPSGDWSHFHLNFSTVRG
jgi:Tol biopolymer transport system component